MKNVREPTYSFVILTFILIIIDTILAWLSVVIFPTVLGNIVSSLFIAAAFMILFTLWFGCYGAIAAYVGTLVGSGLLVSDTLVQHPVIALLWALAGLLQVLIPLAAVRNFGVNLSMENPRDFTYVLLFGVIINNLVGAAWATWTLSLIGPMNMVSVFSAWLIGNIIVCLLIVPIALKIFTPKVEKHRLFVKNYWD
ncbi:MAG: hypothetical protein PHT99_05435 [Methanoregula sp.]|nr:hypothetical protein [Methanoregula sp.]